MAAFPEAQGPYDQYTRVHQELTVLSKTLHLQIEAIGGVGDRELAVSHSPSLPLPFYITLVTACQRLFRRLHLSGRIKYRVLK
jgi:hypothetical protein